MKKINYKIVICLILINFLQSCGSLDSSRYSFPGQDQYADNSYNVYLPNRDFMMVSGDETSGAYESKEKLLSRTPSSLSSADLREDQELKRELNSLISIQPQIFADQFRKYEEAFANDSQKIYFLKITSLREREQYLQLRGFQRGDDYRYQTDLLDQEQSGKDAYHGLTPQQVRRLQGSPLSIEVVEGDPQQKQRWAYKVPETNRIRYIYFENGRAQSLIEENP